MSTDDGVHLRGNSKIRSAQSREGEHGAARLFCFRLVFSAPVAVQMAAKPTGLCTMVEVRVCGCAVLHRTSWGRQMCAGEGAQHKKKAR